MSRVTKWKLEKTKVKVVFRLQFHATHIPQSGWDKPYISFIPAEAGKATAKTTKANVRNGTCKWADPIYETTRLLQDSKTKLYEEKLYRLVVAMGSSRSSILGEAIINLAEYACASKPIVVQLPIQGSDSGAILHVTVQLLTSKTGFREFEQQRELSERGLQGSSDAASLKHISSGDTVSSHIEKVSSRVKFKPESKLLPSLEEEARLKEDNADSSAGFDGSSNTSGSLYAEKHDTSGSHDVDSIKSTISADLGGFSLSQSPTLEKGDLCSTHFVPEETSDWVRCYGSTLSVDNDLPVIYQVDNNRIKNDLDSAEMSLHELKKEMTSLQTHHDDIDVEMQKLTELLASELSSTNELAKDVSSMKSECLKFSGDIQYLTNLKMNTPLSRTECCNAEQRIPDGLLILEDKIKDLLNKSTVGFHDKDFSFLIPDLESLHHFLLDLKQKNRTLVSTIKVPAKEPILGNISRDNLPAGDFGMDVCPPEGLLSMNIPGLASQETDPITAMQGEILKLLREVDESKAEKESLTGKMHQMECYYEALIQELEETQKQMLGELQSLRSEHSTCIYTISATKGQMEAMHQDMGSQILQLSEAQLSMESQNKELQSRVLTLEAALKRARLNYSVAVDQLQKDLEVLSSQVLSMYETNENLIKKAFSEASHQACGGEAIWSESSDVEDSSNAARLLLCHSQKAGAKNGERMLLGELKKSLDSQEELYLKIDEEVLEMTRANIHLDIFAKLLRETLRETSSDIILKSQRIFELAAQLETLTKSNESLVSKLQILNDDIDALTKDKAAYVSEVNGMALHNQILEEKLRRLSEDNCISTKRMAELQSLVEEYRSYKSKYEACDADKLALTRLLEESTAENGNLADKISEYKSIYEACYAEKSALTRLLEQSSAKQSNLVDKITELEALLAEYSSYKSKYEACEADKIALTCLLETSTAENGNLSQKFAESEALVKEYISYKNSYEVCIAEKTALSNLLEESTAQNVKSFDKISLLEEDLARRKAEYDDIEASKSNLLRSHNFLLEKLQGLLVQNSDVAFLSSRSLDPETDIEKISSVVLALEEHQKNSSERILQLLKEKTTLEEECNLAQCTLTSKNLELEAAREKFESEMCSVIQKLELSDTVIDKLQAKLDDICGKLYSSSKTEGISAEIKEELLSDFSHMEAKVQELTSKNEDLSQEIFVLKDISQELGKMKRTMSEVSQEKEDLTRSLQRKSDEVIMLESELKSLKQNLMSLNGELSIHRDSKERLENEFIDITSQLNEKNENLHQQEAELIQLREEVSDLKFETSRLPSELLGAEELLKEANVESSSGTKIETYLVNMNEQLVAADIAQVFIILQYECRFQELINFLESSEEQIKELKKKNLDLDTTLNQCLDREAGFREEIAKLSSDLESARSELDSYITQYKAIQASNFDTEAELEEWKNHAILLERTSSDDKSVQNLHPQQLHDMLSDFLRDMDDAVVSNQELQIMLLVLQEKLDEQFAVKYLLEQYENNQIMLKMQCDELRIKLAEQNLKTEEFRNLSIHWKELKVKAESERIQAQEKKEDEGRSSAASQESLRIVFIKEQYETRIQELKQQLSISKKHSEEILCKLQDSLNELEDMRNSEVSLSKKNEELSLKILELEDQLQAVLSDNRKKVKAYDHVKAELECSLISLECCKEEKQKLLASLEECDVEKSRISAEVDSLRNILESSMTSVFPATSNVTPLAEQVLSISHRNTNDADPSHVMEAWNATSIGAKQEENGSSATTYECSIENNLRTMQDATGSGHVREFSGESPAPQHDGSLTAAVSNQTEVQELKSTMDLVSKMLERMKIENSVFTESEDSDLEPYMGGLHRELMQLEKVDGELQHMSPSFSDFSSYGNSIERVLALVMELAEALQVRKKSCIQFQSSFLKQHNDEAAIFRSFKDINDLIKDMLELKGKHKTVEMELMEMQERYSQLSLQFAEVEGERQKLMMTLKNVRTSKKLLDNSSSARVDEPS